MIFKFCKGVPVNLNVSHLSLSGTSRLYDTKVSPNLQSLSTQGVWNPVWLPTVDDKMLVHLFIAIKRYYPCFHMGLEYTLSSLFRPPTPIYSLHCIHAFLGKV